jgi:hypothetical protein
MGSGEDKSNVSMVDTEQLSDHLHLAGNQGPYMNSEKHQG